MERIERLVVHVEEAFRLADAGDDSRLRLSLLLFDSAAELMLHRESEYLLSMDVHHGGTLQWLADMEKKQGPLPPNLAELRTELQKSKASRHDIKRYFDAKASYIESKGVLPTPYVRVLRKLHQYRNEAYHRDRLRQETLGTAVKIYGFVVCQMMRAMPPHWAAMSASAEVSATLQAYGVDHKSVFKSYELAAADLLANSSFFHDLEIAPVPARHLVDRLEDFEESLEYATDHMESMHPDDSWDRKALLHLLQLPSTPHVIFARPDVLRRRQIPLTLEALAQCHTDALALGSEEDPIAAFTRFADIEDRFERTETEAIEMVRGIDEWVEDEIDRRKGK